MTHHQLFNDEPMEDFSNLFITLANSNNVNSTAEGDSGISSESSLSDSDLNNNNGRSVRFHTMHFTKPIVSLTDTTVTSPDLCLDTVASKIAPRRLSMSDVPSIRISRDPIDITENASVVENDQSGETESTEKPLLRTTQSQEIGTVSQESIIDFLLTTQSKLCLCLPHIYVSPGGGRTCKTKAELSHASSNLIT